MKLHEIIKKIKDALDNYFSRDDKVIIYKRDETIADLNKKIKDLNTSINGLESEAKTRENIVIDLMNKNNELKINHTKHQSLDSYKHFLDTQIKPSSLYYNYGHGRKRVHTIFADSLKDKDVILTFIKNDLQFDGSKYSTADKIVYEFSKLMSRTFPTRRYYASDTTLYNKVEYWATAKETIEKLHKGGKSFDCDDMMTLKFSSLYYLLEEFFPKDVWRLRGFIVDLWSGGGHALLGWVKEGPNDWVPIETTFRDLDESVIWNKNYVIENQLFYQIRYSFDNNTEYSRV